MGAQHTPGPWQAMHDYDKSGEYTIIGNVDGEIIDGYTHHTYSLICEIYDNDNRAEDLANARLIAEAPAMAAILRDLMSGDASLVNAQHRARAILSRIDGGK